MSYFIVAIDPGQTCGLAVLRVDAADELPVLVDCLEFPGTPEDLVRVVNDLRLPRSAPVVMVVECWEWRSKVPVVSLPTIEMVGMVRLMAVMKGWKPVQHAPRSRTVIPDSRERLGRFWTPNLKPHDDRRQATRHALAYLVGTAHHRPTMGLIFGDSRV